MMYEQHVSTAGGELEWYPEPHFQDGPIKGAFRHVNCIRVAYKGTFKDGTCVNCAQIESLNTFRCKVRRRANLTDDNNVYDSVPHSLRSRRKWGRGRGARTREKNGFWELGTRERLLQRPPFFHLRPPIFR